MESTSVNIASVTVSRSQGRRKTHAICRGWSSGIEVAVNSDLAVSSRRANGQDPINTFQTFLQESSQTKTMLPVHLMQLPLSQSVSLPGPLSAETFYGNPLPAAPLSLPSPISISPSPSPRTSSPSPTPASSVSFAPGSLPISADLIARKIAPFLSVAREKPNHDQSAHPRHADLVARFLPVLTEKLSLFNCPDLTCAAETTTVWAGLDHLPQRKEDPWGHPSFGISPASKSDLCYLFKGFPLIHCEVQSHPHLLDCLEQLIACVCMASYGLFCLCDRDPPALDDSSVLCPETFQHICDLVREPAAPDLPPLVRLALNFLRVEGPYQWHSDAPWDAVCQAVRALIDHCVVNPAEVRRRIVPTWVVAQYLKDRPDQKVDEPRDCVNRFRNLYSTDTAYFKVVDPVLHELLLHVPRYNETHTTVCKISFFDREYDLVRMPLLGVPLCKALCLARQPGVPRPPWDDIARLLVERVADLLKHNYCHGDLRPGNVLVTIRPELRVDLIDFERCVPASSIYRQTYCVDAYNPVAVPGMTQAGASIQQLLCLLRQIPGDGAAAIVANLKQKDSLRFDTSEAHAHLSFAIAG
ncbi:hypothetical protein PAPYR_6853 [Paratrimastix pyriformis]|uniref:Non-specific serine/threonine protein kinase n=1 Tax=Paratrimastix pyriformis TaxID=342808 RepID=A0ABQ8UGS5_9EUKA|nr:hypothetical protein PAPYR_6853 [Paratrimastix pyriformis]